MQNPNISSTTFPMSSQSQSNEWDLIIIGSGAGGGTLLRALAPSGLRILVLERGGFLPQEPQNWSPRSVFREERYRTQDLWRNAKNGKSIRPYEYHFVGGKTKLYGSALLRLREKDFQAYDVPQEGHSPEWPISYAELEPFYSQAEEMYRVHGSPELDPNHPPRSQKVPFDPIPWDDYMKTFAHQLSAQGLNPTPIPLGIDLKSPGGSCIFCRTCDGYPCQVLAKSDADTVGVRPALRYPNVTLWTRAKALRFHTSQSATDQVSSVEVDHDGIIKRVSARGFALAAGAVGSSALLLASSSEKHPKGLANSSDQVGRNLMFHNHTGLVALHPFRRNTTQFQKAIALMDYYLGDAQCADPMGMIQLLGAFPLEHQGLGVLGKFITEHSLQATCLSEDLPLSENRVQLTQNGQIQLAYHHNNERPHRELVKRARKAFQGSGFSLVLTKRIPMPEHAGGHVCGTLKMGKNPATSVLDQNCKTHDLSNLWVIDSSFFPSSGAVNPSLTIMAQALRIAPQIQKTLSPQ